MGRRAGRGPGAGGLAGSPKTRRRAPRNGRRFSAASGPAAAARSAAVAAVPTVFDLNGTYTAKLQAPGAIRWSNGSAWPKVSLVAVPDVIGSTVTAARARLTTAGLRVGTVTTFVDFTCAHIGEVGRR